MKSSNVRVLVGPPKIWTNFASKLAENADKTKSSRFSVCVCVSVVALKIIVETNFDNCSMPVLTANKYNQNQEINLNKSLHRQRQKHIY